MQQQNWTGKRLESYAFITFNPLQPSAHIPAEGRAHSTSAKYPI